MAKLDQLLARLRFESNPEPPVAADSRRRRSRKAILCVLLFVGFAPLAWSAVPAGYSAYIVPGDEDVMLYVLQTISGNDVDASEGMYSAISVTGWTDTTTVYYDHWEDGYEFDPFDPDTTADFIATVNKGTTYDFTSPAIPVPRSTEADCGDTSSPDPDCYYDGRDLIYTAGGGVVVTRGTWPVEIDGVSGVVIAFAWEVYPVRPFLEQYTAPFGEDLVASDGYNTFEDVYALVQATEDNTEIFLNGASQGTYDKGDVWLHEDMQTGDVHSGSAPLQIQYIAADPGGNYEV
ncbi:MAG: hypothetical protein GY906_17535, partial [bacterium]|nr:hypothetical protein [bacterium]